MGKDGRPYIPKLVGPRREFVSRFLKAQFRAAS